MTIQELINILDIFDDKTKEVFIYDPFEITTSVITKVKNNDGSAQLNIINITPSIGQDNE